MHAEQGAVPDMPTAQAAPFFASDGRLSGSSFPWHPSPLSPSFDSSFSFSRAVPLPAPPTVLPYPSFQTALDYCQSGNGPTMPIDYASRQDTRRASGILDTRIWSQSPIFVPQYTPLDPYHLWIDMSTHAPLPRLSGGSNGFTRSFSFNGTLSPDVGPMPQVIPQTQPAPALGPGLSSFMRYQHESAGANVSLPAPPFDHHIFPSSSNSTEHPESVWGDKRQPPTVPYRPPLGQCAPAIKVGDLWIDEDDLYSFASRGSGPISVYRCDWSKTSNPCWLWILGSKARLGAHIRKWHRDSRANSGGRCLWYGCTAKAMKKDSINRHVMTAHFGERFCCKGCDQMFSRKDEYVRHVRKGGLQVCRNAGAAMMYGAECKVIDAHKALLQRGTVSYAN